MGYQQKISESSRFEKITESSSTVVESSNIQIPDSNGDLIKFAGVWLRGNAEDASKKCPVGFGYAMSGGNESKASEYSRQLLGKIRVAQKKGGSRLIDHIAPDDYVPSAASGRALVMACAINYEVIESGILPGGGGVAGCFGEIGFDLIICDFSDRSVVFSIPCRLVFQEKGAAKQTYLVNLYEKHLPDVFVKIAQNQWNPERSFSTVGVGAVTIIRPGDDPQLPKNVAEVPLPVRDHIEMICAQIAGSRLFDATGIAMQPYSNGEEAVFYGLQENLADASSLVAKKIREQHANGVGFLLRKPDYSINIKGIYLRERQGGSLNYTCQCRVVIVDPSSSEIFNDKFAACADAVPYRSGSNLDVWHYSADATVRAFQKFSEVLKKKSKTCQVTKALFDTSTTHSF